MIRYVPADYVRHNNLCSVLNQISDAMLEGEILYREGITRIIFYNDYYLIIKFLGDVHSAFKYLKVANDISENLVYDEPWGWMQPPCHALGGLLLEQVI